VGFYEGIKDFGRALRCPLATAACLGKIVLRSAATRETPVAGEASTADLAIRLIPVPVAPSLALGCGSMPGDDTEDSPADNYGNECLLGPISVEVTGSHGPGQQIIVGQPVAVSAGAHGNLYSAHIADQDAACCQEDVGRAPCIGPDEARFYEVGSSLITPRIRFGELPVEYGDDAPERSLNTGTGRCIHVGLEDR